MLKIQGPVHFDNVDKNGILIPVRSPDKLAEKIIFLFNNKSRMEELGQEARLRADKYFNENLVFDTMKEEYARLLRDIKL